MKFNRKILRSAYQNVRQNKKVHQMDTLGYVLFSRCRPRGDTPRYSSFEISSSTRVYVRINYKKKKKEENPSSILVVLIGETEPKRYITH